MLRVSGHGSPVVTSRLSWMVAGVACCSARTTASSARAAALRSRNSPCRRAMSAACPAAAAMSCPITVTRASARTRAAALDVSANASWACAKRSSNPAWPVAWMPDQTCRSIVTAASTIAAATAGSA